MSHTEEIYITKLTSNLNSLGLEKNKDEFVQNYGKLKEQISISDSILDLPSKIDSNLEIGELFNILEQHKDILTNPDKFDVHTIKMLSDTIELLEDKINKESMHVVNIK